MRALVTGATGFIGLEVARRLDADGHASRLMVRRPSRASLLHGLRGERVQADLTSPDSLRRAAHGMDTVFHLAARATFERYATLRPSIVDGSVAQLQAAIDAGVRRFVYASSLFVYGEQDEPIDRNTVPRPELGYGRAKLEAEEALRRLAADNDVTFSALRLPHVYGSQSLLFDQVRSGWVVFPGRLETRFSHLHVRDAARALVLAAEQNWSGASVVADDSSICWGDFFATLRRFYPRFRLVRVPPWAGIVGTTALRPWQLLTRNPTLHTADTIRGFNLNLPSAPGLFWNEVGARPDYPDAGDGIPAALDDYIRFRWRHPVHDRAA